MRLLPCLSLAAGLALLTSCASTEVQHSSVTSNSRSSQIYINEAIIGSVNSSNSRIEIDLSEQKARLFRVGSGGQQLAIETAVSTGMRGMETPTGSFRILEKMRVKDSNLYGIWVDGNSGALLNRDGDSRRPPSSGRPQFQGSPMPYWLKVHPGGAGMHVGYVAGHPISHGCIRVPQRAQALIFEKADVGTPVIIRP
jgi:lipoprotein-anchoring transpeptidase ErfK/SrfK